MNRIVKDGVDITDCEYVTQAGFCNDTLSGSCARNKCQIFNLFSKIQKQQKVLKDIIPILESYVNFSIGEKQTDGTYQFVYGTNQFGDKLCMTYDPRPAQFGLKMIKEVQND